MKFIIELVALSAALLSFATSMPSEAIEASRIVNGFEIDIKRIPYHAALRRRVTSSGWSYMCGAAIIADRAVLTAAHCVVSYVDSPNSLRVVVGTNYRLSGGKSYEVARVKVHKSYDPQTLEHDISVLVTNKAIEFGSNVNSISYAHSQLSLRPGTEALVSGFGRVAEMGEISPILLAAQVNIVSEDDCSRAYRQITFIAPGMVCAAARDPPRDACQGDSGGPLVADNFVVGIVSWGEGCGNTSYPGVYTRVSKYEAWIDDILREIYPPSY